MTVFKFLTISVMLESTVVSWNLKESSQILLLEMSKKRMVRSAMPMLFYSTLVKLTMGFVGAT